MWVVVVEVDVLVDGDIEVVSWVNVVDVDVWR
jgi:hypothetical protein